MFFVSTNPSGEQDDYSSPTSLKYSFEKISHGFQSEDRPDTHSAERPLSLLRMENQRSPNWPAPNKKIKYIFHLRDCSSADACVRAWVGALRARDRMYVEVRG